METWFINSIRFIEFTVKVNCRTSRRFRWNRCMKYDQLYKFYPLEGSRSMNKRKTFYFVLLGMAFGIFFSGLAIFSMIRCFTKEGYGLHSVWIASDFYFSELNPSRLGVLRVPDNEHDRRTMTTDAENSSKKLDSIEEHPG